MRRLGRSRPGRFGRGDLPQLPCGRAGRRTVLRRVRAGPAAAGGRASDRHGPLRGPGRLHRAVRDARPGAGEEPDRRLLRAARGRHRRLRRPRRQDHRRRHRRPLRRAHRPRGRRRARRARRPAHAGDARADLRRARRRHPHARRRQHRRGAGGRAAGRRRLHGDGRRGEHGQPPAERRPARRGARRPGHLRRHPPHGPLRGARADRRQGPRGARAGLAGRRARSRRPGYRPERNRARLDRARARARACSATASRTPSATPGRRCCSCSARPASGKSRLAEELASHAECEHNALDPRGPLRALRRGQHLVAGRRRPPPRRRHPLERPGRQGHRAGPHRRCASRSARTPARPRWTGSTRASSTSWATTPSCAAIDPARAREEATSAVVTYAERFSLHRPVVVVLSDLHWADDLVLELVDTLLDRLSSRRFVVLATARQVVEERWHPPHGRHNLVVLTLDPLTSESRRGAARASWPAPTSAPGSPRRSSTAAAATRSSSRSSSPCCPTRAWSAPTGRPAPTTRTSSSSPTPSAASSPRASTASPPTSGACSTTAPCSGAAAR